MFLTCSTTTVSPVKSPTRRSFAFTISISRRSSSSSMSTSLMNLLWKFFGVTHVRWDGVKTCLARKLAIVGMRDATVCCENASIDARFMLCDVRLCA